MQSLLDIAPTLGVWLLGGLYVSLFAGGRIFAAALRVVMIRDLRSADRALAAVAIGVSWLLGTLVVTLALLLATGPMLPDTLPEWQVWTLVGVAVATAFFGVAVGHRLCRGSIRFWTDTCSGDDFLGSHGAAVARVVGGRVARYRCRFVAAALGSAILLVPAVVAFLRGMVRNDSLAAWGAVVPLLLWIGTMAVVDVLLVYVDPLAVLVSRTWFRVIDRRQAGRQRSALDRLAAPLSLPVSPEARVLATQRGLLWVAATGLSRVAANHPAGVDTAAAREHALAKLAVPEGSERDVREGVREVVDIMVRGVISGAVVTSRISSPLPPGAQRLRKVSVVLVAVAGAPLVLAAVGLVRDLLGGSGAP